MQKFKKLKANIHLNKMLDIWTDAFICVESPRLPRVWHNSTSWMVSLTSEWSLLLNSKWNLFHLTPVTFGVKQCHENKSILTLINKWQRLFLLYIFWNNRFFHCQWDSSYSSNSCVPHSPSAEPQHMKQFKPRVGFTVIHSYGLTCHNGWCIGSTSP